MFEMLNKRVALIKESAAAAAAVTGSAVKNTRKHSQAGSSIPIASTIYRATSRRDSPPASHILLQELQSEASSSTRRSNVNNSQLPTAALRHLDDSVSSSSRHNYKQVRLGEEDDRVH